MMISRAILLNVERIVSREYWDALIGMQSGSFRTERSSWAEREAWKSPSWRAWSASSCSSMSTQKLYRWLHCTSWFCYCLLVGLSADVVSREEVNMNLSLEILRRVRWLWRNLCLITVVGVGSWIQMYSWPYVDSRSSGGSPASAISIKCLYKHQPKWYQRVSGKEYLSLPS